MDIAINTLGTFPIATAPLATAFACGIDNLLLGARDDVGKRHDV